MKCITAGRDEHVVPSIPKLASNGNPSYRKVAKTQCGEPLAKLPPVG